MIKKPTQRFVDLCIDVDAHIMEKDERVVSRVYTELTQIAFMLILKKKYFTKQYYSEQFAYYLANITYIRMTTPRQFLPEDDPKFLSPVKSCLNYMKAVLYPKKCEFAAQEFGFNTREGDIEAANLSRQYLAAPMRNTVGNMRRVDIEFYIKTFPRIFKKVVNESMYGHDKRLSHYLYISVLRSFINTISMTPQQARRYEKIKDGCSDERKQNLMTKFYDTNAKAPASLYGLDFNFETYVHVLMQKVKQQFTKDIIEICDDYDLSDKQIDDAIKANLSEVLEDKD